MEIEVLKEKQDYVPFSSLEVGDTFAQDRDELHMVWMRIDDLGGVMTAVNLNYGEIEYFQPTTPIVPLEAKLIVKER